MKSKNLLASAFAGLMLAGTAHAGTTNQMNSFSIEGSYNQVVAMDVASVPASVGESTEEGGFGVAASYRVGANVAFEVGYRDLGVVRFDDGVNHIDVGVTGMAFGVMGFLPIKTGAEVYGKAGLYKWDADFSGSFGPSTDDGNDTYIGVGVALNASPTAQVFAEFMSFEFDDSDAQTITIGGRFTIGH